MQNSVQKPSKYIVIFDSDYHVLSFLELQNDHIFADSIIAEHRAEELQTEVEYINSNGVSDFSYQGNSHTRTAVIAPVKPGQYNFFSAVLKHLQNRGFRGGIIGPSQKEIFENYFHMLSDEQRLKELPRLLNMPEETAAELLKILGSAEENKKTSP